MGVSILSKNPILSFESSLFYFRFIFYSISISYFLSKYSNHISKIKTIDGEIIEKKLRFNN